MNKTPQQPSKEYVIAGSVFGSKYGDLTHKQKRQIKRYFKRMGIDFPRHFHNLLWSRKYDEPKSEFYWSFYPMQRDKNTAFPG